MNINDFNAIGTPLLKFLDPPLLSEKLGYAYPAAYHTFFAQQVSNSRCFDSLRVEVKNPLLLVLAIDINPQRLISMYSLNTITAARYGGHIGRAMCRLPCDDVHATIDDVNLTMST